MWTGRIPMPQELKNTALLYNYFFFFWITFCEDIEDRFESPISLFPHFYLFLAVWVDGPRLRILRSIFFLLLLCECMHESTSDLLPLYVCFLFLFIFDRCTTIAVVNCPLSSFLSSPLRFLTAQNNPAKKIIKTEKKTLYLLFYSS